MRAVLTFLVSCLNTMRDCLRFHLLRTEYADNNASVSDMLVQVVLDVQFDLHETLKKDSDFTR